MLDLYWTRMVIRFRHRTVRWLFEFESTILSYLLSIFSFPRTRQCPLTFLLFGVVHELEKAIEDFVAKVVGPAMVLAQRELGTERADR